MKFKYIISSIILWVLAVYSASYPEKYHVLIPVFLGSICILSICALATDRKDN